MIDISVLQVIYRFRVAQAVPLDGGATYAEIAKKTGLSHHRVASVMRQAMTNRIFHEDKLNHVVHTAISAVLVKDPVMWDWVGHHVEEAYPTSAKWTEAIVRHPNSQEPNESPFAVAFGDSAPGGFFKYLADNNVPQARFFGTMKGLGTAPGLQHHHIANGYAWDKLGSATVVDVSHLPKSPPLPPRNSPKSTPHTQKPTRLTKTAPRSEAPPATSASRSPKDFPT